MGASPTPGAAEPPRRDDTEVIHGIEIADPFRPLEDPDRPDTRAWIEAQNARTDAVLGSLPGRDRLHRRLSALLRAGSSIACQVSGERVFSLERWGPHDQTVLVVRPTDEHHPARVLVDPHLLTADPTAAVDWYHASPDGRQVAYGLSRGGDERSTLHVLDVDRGVARRDRIPHTRAASVAWAPDGSGFAYTRFPDPATVSGEDRYYWRKVFWHRLGDPWTADELIWDELPDRTAWPTVSLSRDGRWMLIHVSIGWTRVDVHLIDRATGARTVLIDGIEAVSSFTVVDGALIGVTTLDADRGRVVSAPVVAGWHDTWRTIVPERDVVLDSLVATPRSLLVLSSLDAVSRLERFDHDGGGCTPIELPGIGSLAGLSASRDRDEAFLSFTSFATPPTLFRWRPGSPLTDWSRLREWEAPDDGPQGDYVVEQVTYPSTDGTRIPMFLVRAAGTRPGPDTPCLLTGYGGFAITMGPAYSAAVVAFCDHGGLYAVANIRGGGERGEAWHRAGMADRKPQAFDDFAAAADWLVEQGLTSRGRLGLRGASNGGLLVAAAITRRPDLCRAAQIAVPLADMVRYHRFLIARLWIPEYGDPDHPEDLARLHAWSPYHQVVDDTCYPAVLLTTADGDSRVDPMHARKLAARLQEATACGVDHPVLLREEHRAGHGQGKPVSRQADELADVLGFLLWQLDGDVSAGG